MSSIAFSHRVPEARGPLVRQAASSHGSLTHVYSLMGPWATPSCINSVCPCFARSVRSTASVAIWVTTCNRRWRKNWHRRWRGKWHRSSYHLLHWHQR